MTLANVIIVGAGPAGIGVASLLQQTNIDYLILEKNDIGSSFSAWPVNMEMITPSFPSNAFGQMDLNSICEATSPAFAFSKEHLTGEEYAGYLMAVADNFDLKIQGDSEVVSVRQHRGDWLVVTNHDQYLAKYLIWAAGEFQ
ncbi:MAG: NAD(P)-binding domain-containing protein, partial [Bacteroidota bacterium]